MESADLDLLVSYQLTSLINFIIIIFGSIILIPHNVTCKIVFRFENKVDPDFGTLVTLLFFHSLGKNVKRPMDLKLNQRKCHADN